MEKKTHIKCGWLIGGYTVSISSQFGLVSQTLLNTLLPMQAGHAVFPISYFAIATS